MPQTTPLLIAAAPSSFKQRNSTRFSPLLTRRVSRFLEKAGYLVRDAESAYLDLIQDEEDAMGAIVGASITYLVAFGPNVGRKALTLQAVSVRTERAKETTRPR